MYGAADLFASEYGWGIDYVIGELALMDYLKLRRKIEIRKGMRNLEMMQIVSYPHATEEGKTEIFDRFRSKIPVERDAQIGKGEFDREGVLRLQQAFNSAKIGKTMKQF